MIVNKLVEGVKNHGIDHYEKGWDILVECWSDEKILSTIKGCKTVKGAIKKVWNELKPQVEYRKDIQGY